MKLNNKIMNKNKRRDNEKGIINLYQPTVMNIKVFLQGAFSTSNMNGASLASGNLIPTNDPYGLGFVASGIAANPNNYGGLSPIVDWIKIELRDKNTNTIVVESKACFVLEDGNVVGSDGIAPVAFSSNADSYYVVVNHRNHLGIMTASAVDFTTGVVVINFTDGSIATYGNHAQVEVSSNVWGLWSGDVNGNGNVSLSGANNDDDHLKATIVNDSGNIFNSITYPILGVYRVEDANLNGNILYSGTNNELDIIKNNVLGHPGNIFNTIGYKILEQLP